MRCRTVRLMGRKALPPRKYVCAGCGRTFERKTKSYQARQFCTRACYSASPRTEQMKERLASSLREGAAPRGPESPVWMPDEDASYETLHYWARRYFEDPGSCEFCGAQHDLQWAVRHEWPIGRDRARWYRLCRRCHWHYDRCKGCDYEHCQPQVTVP